MGIPLIYEPAKSRADRAPKQDTAAASRSRVRRLHRPTTTSTHLRNHETIFELLERESNTRSARNSPSFTSSSTRARLRMPADPALRYEATPTWYNPELVRPANNTIRTAEQISLTPRFAPAHMNRDSPARTATALFAPAPPAPFPADEIDPEMPLLRRVGHRSVADASGRQSSERRAMDGLGDRERSPMPEEGEEMHDSWETLLTTITPDNQLPSLDSSFASATASASSALSRNPTVTTVSRTNTPPVAVEARLPLPGVLFGFPEEIPNCEFPTSDGEETDADSESDPIRAIFGVPYPQTTNPIREGSRERPVETTDTNGDYPTIRARAQRLEQSLSSELQQLQTVLDRLSRRNDIPDEFWATAGLSRTVQRELNNTDSQNQTN